LRERVLHDMGKFGVKLDHQKNEKARDGELESLISTDDSPVKVFVIPTDEELVFIEDVVAILEGRYDLHTKFKYSFDDANYKRKAG